VTGAARRGVRTGRRRAEAGVLTGVGAPPGLAPKPPSHYSSAEVRI